MTYSIADAPASDGVRLVLSSPPGPKLTVKLDGKKPTFKYGAGTYILTDPEATSTTSTLSGGPAQVDLDQNGATLVVLVAEGASVSVTEIPDGTYSLRTNAGTVTVNGDPLAPGSTLVTFDLTLNQLHMSPRHFQLKGGFVRSVASNGIDPARERVKLVVGTAEYDLAPGSFRKKVNGSFQFVGKVNGQHLSLTIDTQGALLAEGEGEFGESSEPLTVWLRIGDDAGVTIAPLTRQT